MAKASRKISHIQEQMEDNTIFETWTQAWGIKVYPAYGIDKLKFSFIDKGASGKGKSFDIYVETMKDGAQCFDNWAYDILHGRLERTLAAEKNAGEKYPKAYRYTTGENAEKSIGIMNSNSGGYCINASVPGEDDKKVFCNIPVSFHDLRHIATRFEDSYAPRLEELEQIRRKAAEDKSKWIEKGDSQEADNAPSEAPQTSTQTTSAPAANPSGENKTEKKPTPETTEIQLRTNSTLSDDGKGNFILSAIDKKNNKAEFIFPKQYWESDKYGKVGEQFKKKASEKEGIMVTLHFYVYHDKKYVAKIGK